jgi:hypothetical protein
MVLDLEPIEESCRVSSTYFGNIFIDNIFIDMFTLSKFYGLVLLVCAEAKVADDKNHPPLSA